MWLRSLADSRGGSLYVHEALQVGQTLGIDGPRNNVKLPMLQAFEAVTAGRPEDKLHVESFSARQHAPAAGGFNVVLQRAQRTLFVEQGKSIQPVLLDAGIDAPHCCQDGVCGACQTAVLEGEPDHLDSYLSPAERRSGKTIMPCCSGSKSPLLVLDL